MKYLTFHQHAFQLHENYGLLMKKKYDKIEVNVKNKHMVQGSTL